MTLPVEKQDKLRQIVIGMGLSLNGPMPDQVVQPVLLICKKGHSFSKRVDLIIKQGVRCQKCLRTEKRIEKVSELCEKNDIKWDRVDISSTSQKLEFRCLQNHTFHKRYDLFCVNGGQVCQECNRLIKKSEKNLSRATEIANKFNATLVSTEVQSTKVKILFKCENGHEVIKSLDKIQQYGFCGKCSKNENSKLRKKEFLEKIKKFAKQQKYRLVSETYENNKTKLDFECPKGHISPISWSNFQTGHRCPVCSGHVPEDNYLDRAKILARKNRGQLISSQISHSNSDVKWKCEKGHEFSARLDHVRRGSWCFVCAHGERHTIELMDKCARERGGRCIEYLGKTPHNHNLFLWECMEGHQWKSASINVYNAGKWCRECSTGIGERFCRVAFEAIFGQNFPSGFYDWLRNPETRRPMELDGYNEQLRIAFEHQGVYHEKDFQITKTSDNFAQIERDRIKRDICEERGIVLIEIPEVPRKLKLEDLTKFILKKLNSHGVDVVPASEPDFNKAYLVGKLKIFSDFVEKKGGGFLQVPISVQIKKQSAVRAWSRLEHNT